MPKGHVCSVPNYSVVQRIRWSFNYYSRERGIIWHANWIFDIVIRRATYELRIVRTHCWICCVTYVYIKFVRHFRFTRINPVNFRYRFTSFSIFINLSLGPCCHRKEVICVRNGAYVGLLYCTCQNYYYWYNYLYSSKFQIDHLTMTLTHKNLHTLYIFISTGLNGIVRRGTAVAFQQYFREGWKRKLNAGSTCCHFVILFFLYINGVVTARKQFHVFFCNIVSRTTAEYR
jgi:hypothetical protein